jgi:uncharacterized peroxidase-related enzyme
MLRKDYALARLAPQDKAMLEYVAKLTRSPADTSQQDVEALRRAGFSDRAILDVALITGYFAFVNRLAEGLGVQLEAYWEASSEGAHA